MRYGLRRVDYSPPVYPVEPIAIIDVKAALRVNHCEEDFYIENILIPASREYAEKLQNASIALALWELTLDAFPAGRIIDIPLRPLVSVESIVYVDRDGAEQTLAASSYTVDAA